MKRFRPVLLLGLGAVCGSCGPGSGGRAPSQPWDVSGNYALTYDDQVTLKLGIAGGVREVTVNGYGGIADFGTLGGQPLKVDLAEFCAKPEVQCPSETFWSSVAIDQLNVAKEADGHVINVVNNTTRTLDAGVHAEVRGGLVDHTNYDTFLVGLGVGGSAGGSCAALGLSLAGGRFSRVGESESSSMEWRDEKGAACTPSDGGTVDGGDPDAGIADAGAADGGSADAGPADGGLADAGVTPVCKLVKVRVITAPPGAAVAGIKEGKVALGWVGGCAFGPVVAGATFTLETGFTGKRTGNFDPPPFTPAPALLPDAGLLESPADGGSGDGG